MMRSIRKVNIVSTKRKVGAKNPQNKMKTSKTSNTSKTSKTSKKPRKDDKQKKRSDRHQSDKDNKKTRVNKIENRSKKPRKQIRKTIRSKKGGRDFRQKGGSPNNASSPARVGLLPPSGTYNDTGTFGVKDALGSRTYGDSLITGSSVPQSIWQGFQSLLDGTSQVFQDFPSNPATQNNTVGSDGHSTNRTATTDTTLQMADSIPHLSTETKVPVDSLVSGLDNKGISTEGLLYHADGSLHLNNNYQTPGLPSSYSG